MTIKLKDLFRCYASGIGIRSLCPMFGLSRNTVRQYVRKFCESGITLEQLQSMSEHHLQEMFCESKKRERKPSPRQVQLEALLPDYAARLKHKGVTVRSLYEEYKREHPDGYQHSAFGVQLQRYTFSSRAVGHVEHYAGDQMYIDYAGDKLEIVDELTGEVRKVEVFVAILPCSHYTYSEASFSQSTEDLIRSCENAIRFFGGAPMAIVPDNLKAAVIRSDRHEPVINTFFAAFADHYQCAVCPARVRHPKDKALVENAVKLMYRSVYLDVEGLVFHDIDSLNAAIRVSLERFNGRRLTGREESRRELFLRAEADFLNPLPAVRFQQRERKTATVMKNSYVTLFRHHYSMPKEYIGKRVEIVYDADTLDIYHGMDLVTSHQRDDTPYGYTQKEAHHLPGRHGSYEEDLREIYQRASEIDNALLSYLKEVTAERRYLAVAFRSCRGIMSLEEKFGLDRLVAACMCASQLKVYGYQDVLGILNRGDDADFLGEGKDDTSVNNPPVQHENIRGRDYYADLSNEEGKEEDNDGNK
ncbi:MAG: IS21 family transposase [Prevotella sp.]|nr:IS21 family transposase [Prevotella sp.]